MPALVQSFQVPVLLTCHWYDRSSPDAVTVKVAFSPSFTFWLAGCFVISGGAVWGPPGSMVKVRFRLCHHSPIPVTATEAVVWLFGFPTLYE